MTKYSMIFVAREETYPPGSKRVRLWLASQAVKNMFTSGDRSYSEPNSSLKRRNLPCM